MRGRSCGDLMGVVRRSHRASAHSLQAMKRGVVTGNLAGEAHSAERSWQSGGSRRRGGPCPTCGSEVFPVRIQGPAVRAIVSAPIAAALRLTDSLSARENAVLGFLGLGYDNRSIARDMKVSERTVKRHVTVILAKLHLESRLQAGLVALLISSFSHSLAWWPEGPMAIESWSGETLRKGTDR